MNSECQPVCWNWFGERERSDAAGEANLLGFWMAEWVCLRHNNFSLVVFPRRGQFCSWVLPCLSYSRLRIRKCGIVPAPFSFSLSRLKWDGNSSAHSESPSIFVSVSSWAPNCLRLLTLLSVLVCSTGNKMKPSPRVLKSILLGLFHVIAVLWGRLQNGRPC